MKRWVALCAIVGASVSFACDRAASPFELDLGLAAAVADRVVVGTVEQLTADGVARIHVTEVLKTDSKLLEPKPTMEIAGALKPDVARMCGGRSLEVGKSFVFLVWSNKRFTLIDAYGGVVNDEPTQRAKLAEAMKAMPPVSPWKSTANHVDTRLVPAARTTPPSAEVDLLVVLRNVDKKPVEFQYSDWPEASATTCLLAVTDAQLAPIASKPVPISRSDIEEYFSRNGRRYSVTINPGEAHVHRLPRVTTAAPGWGYKEELGFRYYPLERKGRYAFSADCLNFFGPGSKTVAGSLRLSL